jgi:PHP family Zn ribbon phosphoesterase
MPLYDLSCLKCKLSVKDFWCSVSKMERLKCPKCGGLLHNDLNGRLLTLYSVSEGAWTKDEKGQEKYVGKGGKQVPYSTTRVNNGELTTGSTKANEKPWGER